MLYALAAFLCSGKWKLIVFKAFPFYFDICTKSFNIIITAEAPEIGESWLYYGYTRRYTKCRFGCVLGSNEFRTKHDKYVIPWYIYLT